MTFREIQPLYLGKTDFIVKLPSYGQILLRDLGTSRNYIFLILRTFHFNTRNISTLLIFRDTVTSRFPNYDHMIY